jgi:hypothetical protein
VAALLAPVLEKGTYLDEFIGFGDVKFPSISFKFIVTQNPLLLLLTLNEIEINNKRVNGLLPSLTDSNDSPLLGLHKHKIILLCKPLLVLLIILLRLDHKLFPLLLMEITISSISCPAQFLESPLTHC